jgi:hypothetical protein
VCCAVRRLRSTLSDALEQIRKAEPVARNCTGARRCASCRACSWYHLEIDSRCPTRASHLALRAMRLGRPRQWRWGGAIPWCSTSKKEVMKPNALQMCIWSASYGWLVGASGFEPPTSATRTRRSTRLSHAPRLRLTMWRMVPKAGVEPARGCPQQFLRLPRLPFRHFGVAGGIIAERSSEVKRILLRVVCCVSVLPEHVTHHQISTSSNLIPTSHASHGARSSSHSGSRHEAW